MNRRSLVYCFVLVVSSLGLRHSARAQEFRALWVDTFHAALRNGAEVSQLVADGRAGNFNAVIVEVRKRGDAYYNSNFEPKATDVSPQSFDPLADLITKAHNTNNGPRLEVHAWIVTYNIWNNQSTLPSQATHPYRLHPDWVTKNNAGATWDGSNYAFDPAHPGVQQHTFNVCLDIVSRYDVDGLNFDYIRYAGDEWGYNDTAVARFNQRFNRAGQPDRTDAQWLQFRRDQVSALVRKVYLNAIALKPQIKITADTICFAPGPASPSGWFNSAAYTDVLQDWRGWMEEGILDMSIPMAYFDQGGQYAYSWTNWNTFAKDHRYNRHTAIGPGIYLNSPSNALFQMRYTRRPSPGGNHADGVCGYSYAVPTDPNEGGISRATFLAALTQTNTARLYDPNPEPIFVNRATPPIMPWKTSPTRGHVKGIISNGVTTAVLDGAIVTLTGPANRVQTNDATGFFGFVDLPPGSYTVNASFSNLVSQSSPVTISNGIVSTVNFALSPPGVSEVVAHPGRTAAIISWNTQLAANSQVEYGVTANLGAASVVGPALVTAHSVLLSALQPNTNYFFRVISRAGTNTIISPVSSFATAGEIIIDNPNAAFAGSWSTGTSSTDKYSTNYRFATAVSGSATATATFTPLIATPGKYDVYLWYPQGGNRSVDAPCLVSHNGGSLTVRVDQTSGGGAWRLMASGRNFARGNSGFVRVSNSTSDPGKVVMADAVRFVYSANQDPPPAGEVPEWWAQFYFGGTVDAALDQDNDGVSTASEYIVGTNPTAAAAKMTVEFENVAADAFQLAFSPYHAGRLYELQAQASLASNAWTTVPDAPLASTPDGRGIFSITNLGGTQNFYRLKIQLLPE